MHSELNLVCAESEENKPFPSQLILYGLFLPGFRVLFCKFNVTIYNAVKNKMSCDLTWNYS